VAAKIKRAEQPKILVVDEDEQVRTSVEKVLEAKQVQITTTARIDEALYSIDTEPFDVLLSDLQMTETGDGFAAVSAMHNKNPDALTLVYTGYPELRQALDVLLLQSAEVLVRPSRIPWLLEPIHEKLEGREAQLATNEQRVAAILERDVFLTIIDWLDRVERDGELTRVTLARALLADADLLLLDEPTNHLDIDSVEWLEQFLLDYPKAYVLVTHDRRLLERVGSRVLALEHGAVATVGGDFATYMRERAAGNELTARRYEQDKDKIEQLQRFYDRFHAKKLKAKQAKAKLTQIERIKRDMKEPARDARRLHLGLPQPTPSARVVLELKTPAVIVGSGVSKRALVRAVDVVIERGEKVALLGPNGSGKTTLAETIVGLRTLAEGVAYLGHNVRLAYFSQQGRELDETATVLPESVALEAVNKLLVSLRLAHLR